MNQGFHIFRRTSYSICVCVCIAYVGLSFFDQFSSDGDEGLSGSEIPDFRYCSMLFYIVQKCLTYKYI